MSSLTFLNEVQYILYCITLLFGITLRSDRSLYNIALYYIVNSINLIICVYLALYLYVVRVLQPGIIITYEYHKQKSIFIGSPSEAAISERATS